MLVLIIQSVTGKLLLYYLFDFILYLALYKFIRDTSLTPNSDRELQPYQRYEGHTGCVEVRFILQCISTTNN